ncbi:unnamed protein product, partial [Meganyctiphanes norvegica]
YRYVSIILSLLSTARGASFLLEMMNIAPHTTSALKIVYLMITMGIRTFCFIATGTHAKFMFNVYTYENPMAWVSWLTMYGTATIIPAILVLKNELPCRGAGHMVWTALRLMLVHYWLDIITPYGLLYSMHFMVGSICVLMWSGFSPLYDDYDDTENFDEKVFLYGNVTLAIFCILVNIIVIFMAMYRVGGIGKCVRNVWIDLNIYKKDNLEFANIGNGKLKKKQNKYLYNILHLFSSMYNFLNK